MSRDTITLDMSKSDQELSCCDSMSSSCTEDHRDAGQSQKKQKTDRKLHGAAVYSTGYSKNKIACIAKSSVSDEHIFCTVCKRDVSVKHQGIADITRHVESNMHKSRVAGLRNQPLINFKPHSDPLHYKASPLSYRLCTIVHSTRIKGTGPG